MKIIRIPLDKLVRGNCRDGEDEEAESRQLDASMANDQDYPILVSRLPDGRYRILDGHRRAASAARLGWPEIDASEVEGPLTEKDIRRYQLRTDLHKKKLSAAETLKLLKAIAADNPGLPRIQLAEIVEMEPPTLTKYLAEVVPAVDEAFFAGKIGLTKRYEMSKLTPDQQEAQLSLAISGTRDDLVRQSRAKTSVSRKAAGTTAKIKIHLAVNTNDVTANGVVTVAALPGEDLSLVEVETTLREALKAVKGAISKGWSPKTFAKAMADMAAAN